VKSTPSFLAGLFFLTTIALAIVAYQEYTANLRLRAEMFDPSTGLKRELADAQKTTRDLRDQLAAMRANLARRMAERGDEGRGPGAGGPGNRSARRAQFEALMDSPQFQALMSLQAKSRLDGQYADLFKELTQQYNLSPQQLDQFKNLLVQRQEAQRDAVQAARQNGISPQTDPQAWKEAMTAATGDIDSQIQSDLGSGAYSAYQTYQQTASQRATVTQLQQSLSYTSAPLTDAQSQQLVTLLQQSGGSSTGRNFAYGGPFGGGAGGPQAQITPDVISQASSFLNPSQVAALQQLQQAQQAQQQMGQLIRAQFQNRTNGN
jgi:hypothetical protein